MRIETYVSGLARPRVGGVAAGQQLRVDWPTKDPIALLAFLLAGAMVDALTKEIERNTNTPMSPAERKRSASPSWRAMSRGYNGEHWRSVPISASCPPQSCWA